MKRWLIALLTLVVLGVVAILVASGFVVRLDRRSG